MAKYKYKFNHRTLSFERVNNTRNWLKILLRVVIILGLIYFILGYSFVVLDKFDQTKFFNVVGIVGTIASIIGLFSLFSNKINRRDIENIGTEYLREVVEASEKLKEKESILLAKEKQLSTKERQIQDLELKKVELEFVIRKASMTIFLKDQLERVENRIVEIVNESKEISKTLQDRNNILKQLKELDEQIELSNNSKLVEEILDLVYKKKEEKTPKDSSILNILLKGLFPFN